MIVQTEALILRVYNYAEADKIVAFLTPEWGKCRGIAKGARKSQKRFGPALEIGSFVRLHFRKTLSELVLLQEAISLWPDPKWRKSWEGVTAMSVALEWMDGFVKEHQPALDKFRLLLNFIREWEDKLWEERLIFFEKEVLHYSGWGLAWEHCHRCGKKLALQTGSWRFDPEHGGFFCEFCHGGRGMEAGKEGPQTLYQVQRLLETCFETAVGRPMKSVRTLHEIMA